MIRRPPRSPLFPSTTLFRSERLPGTADFLSIAAAAARLAAAAILAAAAAHCNRRAFRRVVGNRAGRFSGDLARRSEEHTSELQSPCNLVCRLLLEKKKANPQRRLLPDDSSRSTSRTRGTNCPRRHSTRLSPWRRRTQLHLSRHLRGSTRSVSSNLA